MELEANITHGTPLMVFNGVEVQELQVNHNC